MADNKSRLPWETEPYVNSESATQRALKAARSRATDPSSSAVQAYARRAFDAEIEKLRNAPSGERNHQLFKSAANLYELVAAQTLSEAEVAGALRDACDSNGLTKDDGTHQTEATIASGRRKGMDNPRDLSHVGTGTNGFLIEDAPVKTVSLSTVFDLERNFWDSRQSLRTIYLGALSRMCAPWAVLGYCAARALATVRPHCLLPPIIGGHGTLNWFCAIAATSGGGKSSAESVARELVNVPVLLRNLGSGEGVIDAYIKPANKESGEPKGQHESVMFVADEISTVASLSARSGNTMMDVLKTGFTGGTIGFSYRTASDVHLDAHSYRMTLVANVQPARAGALMDDDKGGMLQRIMWFPGHDPRITVDTPAMPGPLDITPNSKWLYDRVIKIPYEAVELIKDDRARRARLDAEQEDAGDLNGHSLYIREKFAFALAVLDGRDEMTYDDWVLAGIATKVSDHTRSYVRAQLDKAEESESTKRGKQQGIALMSADEERTTRTAQRQRRIANLVLEKLKEAGETGMKRSDLNRAIAHRDRPFAQGALDALKLDGLIDQTLDKRAERWVILDDF